MKQGLFVVLVGFLASARVEHIDFVSIERFCYPQKQPSAYKSCECNHENAPLTGIPTLAIDCSYKELSVKDLNEVLPLYTTALDLSWNALVEVPHFASDSLRLLNLMHNNISALTGKNFVKVSNLQELYLNWNSIQSIEWNAFDDLSRLHVLDLSHNNLHALSLQIFKPMVALSSLSLSWNRQINQTDGIEDRDFYQTFGVSTALRELNLEACSLVNLTLPENAALEGLNLRRNRLTRVPSRLSKAIKKIDLSENMIETLKPEDTENLSSAKELYLEDMMRLANVESNAFVGLKSLEKLSFQNSRHLNSISEDAFGVNATTFPPLRTVVFRGTMLRGFNASMAPVFRQLTTLDLKGMPIHCDCELIWFRKEVTLETNGRCFKPSRLRGMLVSAANVSDFSCNTWPKWLYGLIVFGLIVLCSVSIYFIVLGLRPHHGVTLRRKIGAGSPYARVTIEPNRQEHI